MNRTIALMLGFCALAGREAQALPPGRTWVPRAEMTLPGYIYLGAPRLDLVNGVLSAATFPRAVGSAAEAGLRWRDSTWVETWRLGYATTLFWPVIAPPGETHLIWCGATIATEGLLAMAQVLGDSLAPPDTIVRSSNVNTENDAAVGTRRRWAAVDDQILGPNGYHHQLRVFFSDSAKIWREAHVDGSASRGVTMAPVDDTTAVVVWASFEFGEKLQWGLLRGSRWEGRGQLHAEGGPIRPRLRTRPSGGFWLTWGTESPDIFLSSYQNGTWSAPIRITADYLVAPHEYHFSEDTEMSRDDGEHPVIAWDNYSPISGGEITISFPTKTGYSLGEVVVGSGGGVLPSLVRDMNGDTWLTWWEEYRRTWWTHTYTRATASELHVEGKGRRRSLVWTLSEPAPDSWWAVFAGRNEGPLEQVARVQAGDGLEVRWPDTSPPAGRLRYKIRRECLDTRYQWESEPIAFPEIHPLGPVAEGPALGPVLKRPTMLSQDSVELSVEHAAPGEVELSLYDLQGRRLANRRIEPGAGGALRSPIADASTPLTPGIYFARVRDAAGRESNAVRFVVIR